MDLKENPVYIFNSPVQAVEGLKAALEHNGMNWFVARQAAAFAVVRHTLRESGRPCLWIDMHHMQSVGELTEALWAEAIALYSWKAFSRALDAVGTDASSDTVSSYDLLQLTFCTLEYLSRGKNDLLVVLKEVRAVERFSEPLDDTLICSLFEQKCVKYIFLSSPDEPREARTAASELESAAESDHTLN